jgi:hypothetical protein
MESFYHTLKTEMVYFQRFRNLVEAIAHIRDYLHFYNHERLHSLTALLDESHPRCGKFITSESCKGVGGQNLHFTCVICKARPDMLYMLFHASGDNFSRKRFSHSRCSG